MIEWSDQTMEDISLGIFDGPHATPKPSNTGPVFLGIKNITEDGHFNLEKIRHISEEEYPKWTKRVTPQEGDIVFTYEATLNRYAVIPGNFKCCLGRRMALIRPDTSKVDADFLFYYFFTPQWREVIRENTISGSTVDRIPLTYFPEYKVRLPKLDYQRKVSGVIHEYTSLIENNNSRIKILEEMAQAIYTEWFVSFRFPGHKKVKFIDSGTDFGNIPSDWSTSSIKDTLDHYIGGGWGQENIDNSFCEPAYVIRGTDIPSVKKGDVTSVPYRYHKTSNLRSRTMQKEDIVFEVSGGSKGQPLGRTCLLTQNLLQKFDAPIMCASFCKLMRVKSEDISSYYFYLLLNQWYENGVIEKYQVQSTGISNFQFESFIDTESVLLASKEVRKKFDEFVEPIFEQISNLGAQNVKLREMRDLLIPKLATGEVEIKT